MAHRRLIAKNSHRPLQLAGPSRPRVEQPVTASGSLCGTARVSGRRDGLDLNEPGRIPDAGDNHGEAWAVITEDGLPNGSVHPGVFPVGQEGRDLDEIGDSHARLLKREHQVRPDQPALIFDAGRNKTVSGLRDLPTHEQQARDALDFESVYIAPGRLGNADGIDWAQVHDQDPTASPTDASESLTY